MKVKTVRIKNFRGIGDYEVAFNLDDFNLVIGDNGTSKTSILEAVNLCLSSGYTASKLSIDDFYCGGNKEIELSLIFDTNFDVEIPDLYGNKQKINCNGICVKAKKREKSAPGRSFNDLVVVEHYFLPIEQRSTDGWIITRGTGTSLKITERQLALSYSSAEYPRSFYFGKNRDRQLQKGFNSSMSNIIDELNWRFEKKDREKLDIEKFKNKRTEVEQYIFDNTDGDTLKKTIESTNTTLKTLGIPEINLSVIKTLTPYDSAQIVKRFDGFEIPISSTGSGIEMVTSLIFLETLAKISKSKICIIIDEPELHLHPVLQVKLAKHLQSISSESQVIISTHSPFFFKNCFGHPNIKVLISSVKSDKIEVSDAKSTGFGLLKWSPSWGEICYFAYNLPTIEFHDDLYSTIEDNLKITPAQKVSLDDTENWLLSKGESKEIRWKDSKGGLREETLMTYIRNRVHHPDNISRPLYTHEQLEDSLKRMIVLLS